MSNVMLSWLCFQILQPTPLPFSLSPTEFFPPEPKTFRSQQEVSRVDPEVSHHYLLPWWLSPFPQEIP